MQIFSFKKIKFELLSGKWWLIASFLVCLFNTSRPRRNGQHFADGIFKHIFFNKNVWISIRILLKFVPKGPINNIPALVQIMAWCHPDGKPLSEPMMVILQTHICITPPRLVYRRIYASLSLNQLCHQATIRCDIYHIICTSFFFILHSVFHNLSLKQGCKSASFLIIFFQISKYIYHYKG